MSVHLIGFAEETVFDIESKQELTMLQSIMVYWKVMYVDIGLPIYAE